MERNRVIADGNSRFLECDNISSFYKNNIILDYSVDWPKKTDICCWWCCNKFENTPVPIPVEFTKKDIFKVYGNFCSFNCSKSFLQSKEHLYSNKNDFSLLSFFCKKITGKRENIISAPSKLSLKMFGGNLTIEEFRKNNIKISIINYPFIPIQSYIQTQEKQIVNKVINSKKFKVERNNTVIPVISRGLSSLGIKVVKKE